MSGTSIARIAVSGVPFRLDRPYDYEVPAQLAGKAVPGVRVTVPFSRTNRPTEGIILALAEESEYRELKSVAAVLDEQPLLDARMLSLAMWMHERFFCTVYESVKAILPAGFWFKGGKRRVNEKYLSFASLAVPAEEALEAAERKKLRAHGQSELLRTLSAIGRSGVRDLLDFTGASRQSLNALVKAGFVTVEDEEVFRRPEISAGREPLPELNASQQRAFEGIDALARAGKAGAALLFGVTGSGKTTVYIRLIASQLAQGKGCILLVPEIALTPQMLRTFAAHFGGEIAVLHSSLTAGERFDEWRRIKGGAAHVVIGTRSAVFAPVDSLGLIIIDEEQEDAYKSENAPRYHARDVAKYRCAQNNALLLLGSATPDVESRYWSEEGRYAYFSLDGRYNERGLPAVEIVDLKQELRRGNGGAVSGRLREELAANIERGEQSILFINRRGANKLVTCVECGFSYRCPNCSVSLTFHSYERALKCHHCGWSQPLDERCPECGGRLKYVGAGTQKVEEELRSLFPDTEILRMDTDTVAEAGGHDKLLERFRAKKIPIMVGTQMVTKGLNFENVTLVGVICADQGLYAGDYRAGERSFSLITQVVGRSGRFEKPGRAVIQTYTPENEIILQAARQDYESFYRSEIQLRRLQALPPFTELMSVTLSGLDESQVLSCAEKIKGHLYAASRHAAGARVLGPAPLSILKINNNYRYRVTLCAAPGSGLRRVVADTVLRAGASKLFKGVNVYADTNASD